jgi:prepilin-type N-terminal cleavage/methylation domain-containing protein
MGRAAPTTRRPRGFSIVEVAISLVVVGLMMVAALGAVGTAARTDQLTMDSSRGRLLAEELMAEIMLKAYSEPSGGLAAIGSNVGEVVASSRALYDDVDDYDGWVETPCRMADGTAIAGTTGWSRRVTVAWVSAADPATASGTDSGVKRIVVQVTRDGRQVAQLTALRTRAWPLPPYLP